jgi:MFS family permease
MAKFPANNWPMNEGQRQTGMPVNPDLNAENSAYAVLRNRNVLLYLAGRLVFVVGQQMFVMAVGWELYERTHSAFMLGLVGLTQVVPMFLFTLPAGHLADNHNRKHIIFFTTLIVAGANAALTWISAATAPVIWFYVCLFVAGTARTFLWASTASFLPQLVERRYFSRAVTWQSGIFQLSSIIGPTAAGALIGFCGHRAAPVYAVNAAAALAFCTFIGFIRWKHVAAVREDMTLKTLLTGFKFVFANRIILGIVTLDMFAVLLGGATALLPVYAKEILQIGPRGLGFLQAALPAGAVACTFLLAHRPPIQKAGRSLLLAVTAFGLATIGFGFSKWFWLSFLMLFVCGAVDNVSVVVRHTLVQMLTPDEKRGRVSAVNNLFIGTSNELGEFESGTIAYLAGPAIGNAVATGAIVSVVAGGVGTILVVMGVAWMWPEIGRYGRLDAV